MALEKGLKTAIKQAEKSNNPYLIDQLHDLLAGPYYETLKKKVDLNNVSFTLYFLILLGILALVFNLFYKGFKRLMLKA